MANFWDVLRTSGFIPHSMCITSPGIIAEQIIGDVLIAVAYFAIPCILWYLSARKSSFRFNNVLKWFAAFIVLCGCTHIISVVVLYHPVYVLEGHVKILTGILSWIALVKLVPSIYPFLTLSAKDLENLNLLHEVGKLNDFARMVHERDIQKSMRLKELASSLETYANSIGGGETPNDDGE